MNMNNNDTILPPLFRSMNLSSLGPLPPLTRGAGETTTVSHKEQQQQQQLRPISISPTTTISITPIPTATWSTTATLRPLGYYHPLDPSHVTVDRSALDDVLIGLPNMLAALSCQVTYAPDTYSATAVTMHGGVHFVLALYAARDDPSHSVIVEVQRTAGDAYTFHTQYAQPLLKAVSSNNYNNLSDNNSSPRSMTMGQTLHQLESCSLPMEMSTTTEDDIDTALELAAGMILSDRYDACLLGMESLACLTNPSSTTWQTALTVATRLVNDTSSNLHKFLSSQLLNHDDSADDELHYGALQIWTQVWQVLAADDAAVMTELPSEDVIVVLVRMVQQAAHAPHHATLALQGLTALHALQHPSVVTLQELTGVAQQAQAVGQAQHAALLSASTQLLAAQA